MRVKRNEKNKPSGSGAKPKTKWPYCDLMSFLDQFTESRDTSGNVQQESPHQPRSMCDEVEFETGTNDNVPEENVPTEAVNTENGSAPNAKQCVTTNSTTRNSKKFKRRTEAAVGDDVDSQYLAELRKINSSRADENDPDRMFLLSLLPSMKQLTPADNMDFKLNALQFLKCKLNPTFGLSYNSFQPQPPDLCYQNHQQSQPWSSANNFASGSSRSSSVSFVELTNEGSSPPQHQMTSNNN